jgi:mono/diheme cytochrome c family protein
MSAFRTKALGQSKLAAAAVALSLSVLSAASPVAAQPAKDPKADRLWRAKCAACHGDDGSGKTDQGKKMGIRDVSTAAWQKEFSDAQIQQAITDGVKRERDGKKQEMEAYKDKLRPDQLPLLVAYMRALAK